MHGKNLPFGTEPKGGSRISRETGALTTTRGKPKFWHFFLKTKWSRRELDNMGEGKKVQVLFFRKNEQNNRLDNLLLGCTPTPTPIPIWQSLNPPLHTILYTTRKGYWNRFSTVTKFVSIYYCPQQSCSKVMFLHLSVILFTGDGSATPGQTPPWQTPLGRHPQAGQTFPLHSACCDMVNKPVVSILLECILVSWISKNNSNWQCKLNLVKVLPLRNILVFKIKISDGNLINQ